MAIINNDSEAPAGQVQPCGHISAENVKVYFMALGINLSDQLTVHVAHKHHEDVPAEVFQEPEEILSAALQAETRRASVPIVIPRLPDRLHSLFPPTNYGAVVPGSVYRGSYPESKNYEFLKNLKLKSIITLVPEPISPEYQNFMKENGIQHFQVHIHANKGEVRVTSCEMSRALRLVMDRSNHPIFIHCNKGKHRTGCTVACFRRIQGIDIDLIRNEYHTYADPKARFLDEVFFEHFDLNTVMWLARQEGWASSGTAVTPLSPPASPLLDMNKIHA